jgi:hypothetical protein
MGPAVRRCRKSDPHPKMGPGYSVRRVGRREFTTPPYARDYVTAAVEHLARLLEIPHGIWSGPLTKGQLPLDSLPEYRWKRLQYDFLSKYPGFSWGNPREAAVRSFHQSEKECELTNSRIRAHITQGYESLSQMPYIRRAQEIIGNVLGRFSWQDVIDFGRWGPGVTSSVKGLRLHASVKFGAQPDVTPAFAKTACNLVSACPSWSSLLIGVDYPKWACPLPNIVTGNRVTFVPKNAKTDRAIAIEPHLNIWFQLGIGRLIRMRLQKFGLDLDTQEVNQRLAALGSIDDSLSTIDLERASDTLSWRTVMLLLPPLWFEALDRARSQFGALPGEGWKPYQKFSSMGNGFTFELESLIFWALCSSVAQLNGYNSFWVQSFGDDIVIPSGIYDEVTSLLAFLGFTVNHEKSYRSGPFRESCGKDYLRGSLVRPVYLKEIPDTPLAWIKIANNLKRLAHSWTGYNGLDSRLKPAWEFAARMVPRELRRLSVSDGYGDLALLRDIDDASPTRAPNGWEGWMTRVIIPKSVTFRSTDRSLITAGVSTPGRTGNDLPLRDKVVLTIGPMFVPDWRNMGPWRA